MPRRSNRTFPPPQQPVEPAGPKPVDRRPRDIYDGSSASLLGNHTLPLVRVECAKCDRRGQYSTAKLLSKHGLYQQMPELRWFLTQCGRKAYDNYCGALFTDVRWLAGLTDELVPASTSPPPRGTPAQLRMRWPEVSTPPRRFVS